MSTSNEAGKGADRANKPAAYVLSGGTRKALAAAVEDLRIEQEIVTKRFRIEATQEFADLGESNGVIAALDAYLAAVAQIDRALRADARLRNRRD